MSTVCLEFYKGQYIARPESMRVKNSHSKVKIWNVYVYN